MKKVLFITFLFLNLAATAQIKLLTNKGKAIDTSVILSDLNTKLQETINSVSDLSAAATNGTVTSVTSADANATVTNTTTTPIITVVSAPKLQTARTINGTPFDGTANITIAASGGNTPQYFDLFGFGQSQMFNSDDTVGAFVFWADDPRIQVWFNGQFRTATQLNMNAGGKIRTNVIIEFAHEYLRDHPYDTVRYFTSAEGGKGSWEWTPKTTGLGEVTSVNTRYNELKAKLDSMPANFDAKLAIVWQGDEDANQNNQKYWLSNFKEIDTFLVNHTKVNDEYSLLFNDNMVTGSRKPISVCIDSIATHTFNIDKRNWLAARFYLSPEVFDHIHASNEQQRIVGKIDYSTWKQWGYATNYYADSLLNYFVKLDSKTISTDYNVRLGKGASTSPFSNTGLQILQNDGSVNDAVIIGRTDGRAYTFRVGVGNSLSNSLNIAIYKKDTLIGSFQVKNDTTMSFQNNIGQDIMQFNNNTAISIKPFFAGYTGISGNLNVYSASGISIFGNNQTTSAQARVNSNNGPCAFEWTSGVNMVPSARITSTQNNNGTMIFETGNLNNASRVYTERMRINDNGRVSIGAIAAPSGLLTIAGGSTSAAQLRLVGSVSPTTPNKGDIWNDTTGTNPLVKYYDGTNTVIFAKTLTGTATLDFDLTSVNFQDLTITVTGAADGDAGSISIPSVAVTSNVQFQYMGATTKTVTIRASRIDVSSPANPASGTFRAVVIKY